MITFNASHDDGGYILLQLLSNGEREVGTGFFTLNWHSVSIKASKSNPKWEIVAWKSSKLHSTSYVLGNYCEIARIDLNKFN